MESCFTPLGENMLHQWRIPTNEAVSPISYQEVHLHISFLILLTSEIEFIFILHLNTPPLNINSTEGRWESFFVLISNEATLENEKERIQEQWVHMLVIPNQFINKTVLSTFYIESYVLGAGEEEKVTPRNILAFKLTTV